MSEQNPLEEKKEAKFYVGAQRVEDTLSPVIFGLILIWAGVVFFAQNLQIFDDFRAGGGLLARLLERGSAWELIALGAGLLLFAEVLLRLVVPSLRRPIFGTLILGLLLFGWGTSNLFAWDIFWPVALVVIGVVVLIRAFIHFD